MLLMNNQLLIIYQNLLDYFGSQNWWPGEGLEIAVGAVLTQQTSWKNVEKAIDKLREADCLSIDCLSKIPLEELEELVLSSGYYKVKAKRLKNLIMLLAENPNPSREELLSVNGLGLETADAILLYWFEKMFFVVDTYTFRILNRLGIYEGQNYLELQRIFMNNIPKDIHLYKEFHALLVKLAKEYCLKKSPKCDICIINSQCEHYSELKKEIKTNK